MRFKPEIACCAKGVKIIPEPKQECHTRQMLGLKRAQGEGCLPATDEAQWIVT
jgi:hypothetical protein